MTVPKHPESTLGAVAFDLAYAIATGLAGGALIAILGGNFLANMFGCMAVSLGLAFFGYLADDVRAYRSRKGSDRA